MKRLLLVLLLTQVSCASLPSTEATESVGHKIEVCVATLSVAIMGFVITGIEPFKNVCQDPQGVWKDL